MDGRQLLLMDIDKLDLTGLSSLYKSMLREVTLSKVCRDLYGEQSQWLLEETFIFNSNIDLDVLKSTRGW